MKHLTCTLISDCSDLSLPLVSHKVPIYFFKRETRKRQRERVGYVVDAGAIKASHAPMPQDHPYVMGGTFSLFVRDFEIQLDERFCGSTPSGDWTIPRFSYWTSRLSSSTRYIEALVFGDGYKSGKLPAKEIEREILNGDD